MSFRLRKPASVLQCTKSHENLCGDVDSDLSDGPTEQTGPSLEFYLYFTNYVTADYVFRVTTVSTAYFKSDQSSGVLQKTKARRKRGFSKMD